MLIVKQTTRSDENGYSTVWNLSEDQMNFLLTFAINTLIGQGLAKIEEQLPDDEAQAQLDLLHDLEPQEIGSKQ
jgi:hypothetical protein